jgi:predicted AlkP superfamily phosphohydrolase/phosphomutase
MLHLLVGILNSWISRAVFCATALLAGGTSLAAAQRVVLLSVDGLDHRYLRDCDRLGLKIPNLRRLMREGAWAQGVIGEVPTITWPSHTTILTGVPPSVHGIQQNQRWDYSLIQVKTLWDALAAAHRTSAAIT